MNWSDRVVAAFAIVVVAMLLVVVFHVIVIPAVDYSFRPLQVGEGEVVNKKFVPSHFIPASPVGVYRVPGKWFVQIKVNNEIGEAQVGKMFGDKIKIGERVIVHYIVGRRTGKIRIELMIPRTA